MKESSRKTPRFLFVVGIALFLCLSAEGNARADDVNAKKAWALFQRAQALDARGDWEQALTCIDNAINLYPLPAYYYFKALMLYNLQEDDKAALSSIDKALQLSPKAPEQWNLKSKILLRLQRGEEALAAAQEGLKYHPEFIELLQQRAKIYLFLKRWQDAENDFTASIKMYEHLYKSCNIDMRHLREILAARLKHWPLVIEDSDTLIAEHRKRMPPEQKIIAYRLRAQALAAMGKTEEAKQAYRTAMATWPDDRQLLIMAKQFFESIGDKPDTDVLAKKIKRFDEDFVPPR